MKKPRIGAETLVRVGIQGNRVTIPGVEDFQFAVHPSMDTKTEPFAVTEMITGLRIAGGHTAKEAVEDAVEKIKAYGRSRLIQGMKKVTAGMEWLNDQGIDDKSISNDGG